MFSQDFPAHPLVTRELITAWLKTRDPRERFLYDSSEHCCLAQYLRSFSAPSDDVRCGSSAFVINEHTYTIPGWLEGKLTQATFGGVLQALEAK